MLIKRYTKNSYAILIGVMLYSFNTYFLTVIDGGVVGLSLAYGIFPLVVYFILNFFEKGLYLNYIYALLFLVLITNTDLRLAILAVILAFIFKAKLKRLILLLLPLILIDSFWLIPFFQGFNKTQPLPLGNNNFVDLINTLTLFSPHFPENIFGKVNNTPFYFLLVPYLIFGSSILAKGRRLKIIVLFSLLFLALAFLTKGQSEPFGVIYAKLVNLPFGVAFRDSTKFFAPLALVGGILVSTTVELINNRFSKKISIIIFAMSYLYLLFLVSPVILGQMNGVLGKPIYNKDQILISEKIKSEESFRTVWFNEKPQVAYADWQHPALSGNTLYQERPFASMNIGGFDLDNFLYDKNFPKWLDLLGVKYIFLPGNPRLKVLSSEELNRQKTILNWVENNLYLEKLDWQTNFPVFKNKDIKPKLFVQEKLVLVLGGEEVYDNLLNLTNFSLANQGFVFLEEGRANLKEVATLPKDSVIILLNDKSIQDLAMSFLQEKMIPTKNAINSQWMYRGSQEYLVWKYDLLKNQIENKEFDYGKGVAFSTIAKESMDYNLQIPKTGNYYLGIRYIFSSQSMGIDLDLNGNKRIISGSEKRFRWNLSGPYTLEKGNAKLKITNLGGFSLVNTIILVPEEELKKAQKDASDILSRFEVIQINREGEYSKFLNSIQPYKPVSYRQIDPTKYQVSLPEEANWLVFSEHFSKDWEIKDSNALNLPFYAMINGFYVGELQGKNLTINYAPQEKVSLWITVSLISLLLTIVVAGTLYWRKKK